MTRCNCCISSVSSPRNGKRCLNKSKPDSDYCGIHKKCKSAIPCPKEDDDPVILVKKRPNVKKLVEDLIVDRPNVKKLVEDLIVDRPNVKKLVKDSIVDRPNVKKLVEDDVYRTCINDTDLVTLEPINEVIDEADLVQIPSPPKKGFCFDVNGLAEYLSSAKKNINPYTQGELWKDISELNQILLHPKLKPDFKKFLTEKFMSNDVNLKTQLAIRDNLELFNLIGLTAVILISDYTKEFGPSLEALACLSGEIPENSDLLNLRVQSKPTVKKILSKSDQSCIHGIGWDLLGIYLYYWRYVLNPLNIEPIPFLTRVSSKYPDRVFGLVFNNGKDYTIVVHIIPDVSANMYPNGYTFNQYIVNSGDNSIIYPYTMDDFTTYLNRKRLRISLTYPTLMEPKISERDLTKYPKFYFWRDIYLECRAHLDEMIRKYFKIISIR